jgi:hypothetical protein
MDAQIFDVAKARLKKIKPFNGNNFTTKFVNPSR